MIAEFVFSELVVLIDGELSHHFPEDFTLDRDAGQEAYPVYVQLLQALREDDRMVLSFRGLTRVDEGFLDETVVRLHQEYPELVERLEVRGLPTV